MQWGVNNTGSTRSIHCVDTENRPGNWHLVGWLRNPWSLSWWHCRPWNHPTYIHTYSVSSKTFKVCIVVLYRPPYSPAHPVTTSTFFTDFADYLETLILSSEPLVITSEFNVHVYDLNYLDATKLLDLLDSLGFCQHVTQPTHELGHTVDLIITRRSDSSIHGSPTTDHLLSDHLTVLTTLRSTKPAITSKEWVYGHGKRLWFDRFLRNVIFTYDYNLPTEWTIVPKQHFWKLLTTFWWKWILTCCSTCVTWLERCLWHCWS